MWNLIGHDRAISHLETAITADRLPHALLITGPAGIGKRSLARVLAQRLNCIGNEPPCGTCVHCHQIAIGSHPDVTIVQRPDGKDSISIDQVRALRDQASLRPFQGRRKVYVIAGAEALTPQAADALLKTLEEPQIQVQMILTAVEADAMPATVVSRCRVVSLHAVPADQIAHLLEGDLKPEAARSVAVMARGSVAWALQAAKQPKLIAQQEESLTTLASVFDLGMEQRLQLVESLTTERRDRSAVRRTVELLVLLARDAVLIQSGMPPQTVAGEPEGRLRQAVGRLSLHDLTTYLVGLKLTTERIDANVDPRLALEAFMVSVP